MAQALGIRGLVHTRRRSCRRRRNQRLRRACRPWRRGRCPGCHSRLKSCGTRGRGGTARRQNLRRRCRAPPAAADGCGARSGCWCCRRRTLFRRVCCTRRRRTARQGLPAGVLERSGRCRRWEQCCSAMRKDMAGRSRTVLRRLRRRQEGVLKLASLEMRAFRQRRTHVLWG